MATFKSEICFAEASLLQCRPQSKRSEGTLAESEGALKQTELLHIKTDILRLQITDYFLNFVFVFEKKRHISPAAFISSFRMRLQSLEKSVCSNVCDHKYNQDFAKREGAGTKSSFISTKLSNLSPVLNKPMQFKLITEGA